MDDIVGDCRSDTAGREGGFTAENGAGRGDGRPASYLAQVVLGVLRQMLDLLGQRVDEVGGSLSGALGHVGPGAFELLPSIGSDEVFDAFFGLEPAVGETVGEAGRWFRSALGRLGCRQRFLRCGDDRIQSLLDLLRRNTVAQHRVSGKLFELLDLRGVQRRRHGGGAASGLTRLR